jgi:serine/threonine-protein kinase
VSTSANESRVQALLEEILHTHVSAEEACREQPELLPQVRERLAQARALQDHLDSVLPTGTSRNGRRVFRRPATKLPQLPGYHVEGVVGSGGMGVVYRARHVKLNRTVAIKMLLAGEYAREHELERFKREAESIASLCHANVVQVFDAGECDGHPYFVMEFMEGGSLAQRLDGRPRRPREAAAQVATLARAIHAAHAAGIMHRDLKPGNILIAADGTLKIADFGLARRSDQPEPSGPLTLAGAHVGTPSYMSPEQAAGVATAFCPLIDIYALGAVLYELLTGRPPFRGESAAETERQVLYDEPVPPIRLSPTVPRDLQTICLKCLQKDPARRYGSAADLADDLDRLSRGAPIHARPIGAAERALKWCQRRPATAMLLVTIVLALASATAGGLWLQRLRNERRAEHLIRQTDARSEIAAALPLLERLWQSRQWSDAAGVLNAANARLGEAESSTLASQLAAASETLDIARELDRIRQAVPEPATVGYSFFPAIDAYSRVFARIGIGRDVDVDTAAARVRASPLKGSLLTALDTAAFAEFFTSSDDERRRLLTIARTADPDPWRDRFRDADSWRNLDSMLRLVHDARSTIPGPPSHELVILSLLLSSLGANDATIEMLRDLQMRDPSDFWVNLELGNALNRAGKQAEALQFFRSAVAIRPSHFAAWTTLGTVLIENKMPEEAIAPLRKAVEIQPAFPTSWMNLISALATSGRWADAYAACDEALAANPNDLDLRVSEDWLRVRHARALAARKEWTEAAELYARALNGYCPNASEAWFELAAVQLLAGDTTAYRRTCRSMLERCENGDLRQFLVARACTLSTVSEEDLARATRLGVRELDIAAQDHWSLTARGALACRAGDPDTAVPMFERSIEARPDPINAVINWVWLAWVYASLGDLDAARPWITKAADWLDQSERMPERIHLHNWLEAQILRREVESMLAR